MFEEFVRDWALRGAVLLEAIAAVVVVVAGLVAFVRGMLALVSAHPTSVLVPLRQRFSQWLALALELLIGSDIIRTAVTPSWVELGRLAAIIALRVALEFTLMRDLK
jgi:uncharacterized membrane protein